MNPIPAIITSITPDGVRVAKDRLTKPGANSPFTPLTEKEYYSQEGFGTNPLKQNWKWRMKK